MRKLAVLLVLAGVGVLAYVFVLSPERRACSKLASLCSPESERAKAAEQCQDLFVEMKKSAPDEAPKLAQCINDSSSCGAAVGCQAGSALNMGLNFGKNFFEGLGRSLNGNAK